MKIIYWGTPEFSLKLLQKLYQNSTLEIVGVVTAPDQKVGRKQILTPSPVKTFAIKNHIPVFTPESPKDTTFVANITSLQPDVMIVFAYGKILPKSLLTHFGNKFVNVHPSLLPQYRGPSPLQTALLHEDNISGVSLIQMDAKMDHGPLIAQKSFPILPEDTFLSLQNIVVNISLGLIIANLANFINHTLFTIPQNHSQATFCQMITKKDGKIEKTDSAQKIIQKYKAYIEWPGVYVYHSLHDTIKKISLLDIKPTDTKSTLPSLTLFVTDKKLYLSTTSHDIEILSLQIEGKPAINSQSFINGYLK
jgi:methionyl-tRNA formyltransferase